MEFTFHNSHVVQGLVHNTWISGHRLAEDTKATQTRVRCSYVEVSLQKLNGRHYELVDGFEWPFL